MLCISGHTRTPTVLSAASVEAWGAASNLLNWGCDFTVFVKDPGLKRSGEVPCNLFVLQKDLQCIFKKTSWCLVSADRQKSVKHVTLTSDKSFHVYLSDHQQLLWVAPPSETSLVQKTCLAKLYRIYKISNQYFVIHVRITNY